MHFSTAGTKTVIQLKKVLKPLTPRVIESFLTFDSMDRTLKCDHSSESCCAILYCGVFQFYPFCNFEEFINFGLGTVSSQKG